MLVVDLSVLRLNVVVMGAKDELLVVETGCFVSKLAVGAKTVVDWLINVARPLLASARCAAPLKPSCSGDRKVLSVDIDVTSFC